MTISFCPFCGAPSRGTLFCASCGHRLSQGLAQRRAPLTSTGAGPSDGEPQLPDRAPAPAALSLRTAGPAADAGLQDIEPVRDPAPALRVSSRALPSGWTDGLVPATFGQRLAARVLDGLVTAVLGFVPVVLVGLWVSAGAASPTAALAGLLLVLLLWVVLPLVVSTLYRVHADGGRSQSVGRAAARIRLVRLGPTGEFRLPQPVGYGRAFTRLVVGGLGDLPFGLGSLMMLGHPHRRTWADRASGTAVVQDPAGKHGTARPLVTASLAAVVLTAAAVAVVAPTLHRYQSVAGDAASPDYLLSGSDTSGSSGSPDSASPESTPAPSSAGSATEPAGGASGSDGGATESPAPTGGSTACGGSTQCTGIVRTSSGDVVNVRTAPWSSAAVLGVVADGNAYALSCRVDGQMISGPEGTTTQWDQLTGSGYVSDAFIGAQGQLPAC